MSRSQLALLTAALFVAACDRAPTQPARSVTPQFSNGNTTTQIRTTISGTITNNCTGEVITYSGEEHGVLQQKTDGTVTTSNVHINTNDLHGVSDTGAKYVIQAVAKEGQTIDIAAPFPQSTTIHEKLLEVSQGSGDNEVILLDRTDTFDGTTLTTTFSQTSTCHG